MKLYAITIKPSSGFGTPLKGDTLFGHFCWQVAHDASLLDGGLEKWIDRYPESPFLVLSSAWPKIVLPKGVHYALKRPDLPLPALFGSGEGDRMTRIKEGKQKKNRKWMLVSENLQVSLKKVSYLNDRELLARLRESEPCQQLASSEDDASSGLALSCSLPHNTINRLTMTTGEGMFAPFEEEATFFAPGSLLTVFALIDENATDIEMVRKGFQRIGAFGFGRNASTGSGRFSVDSHAPVPFPRVEGANASYTLAPSVPERGTYAQSYFSPVVRFGKHGDALANRENPFKNPVIMADEGAVFIPADPAGAERQYMGSAIQGLSKAQPGAVGQGYSIVLPLRVEG